MKKKGAIRTLVTGSIIAIVCVVAILLISIWQSRRLQDTASMIKHTNQVLVQTQDAMNINLRYELAVKNYLLTGDRHFLDSLEVLSSRLHQRLASVKELTKDNPDQQDRIVALLRYEDKSMQLLDEAIRMSQGDDFVGSGRLIDSSASFGYSYQIQMLAEGLKAEETRLLEERRLINQHRASELQYVLWGLIAAVAVLAYIVVKKIRIDLAREEAVKDQLNQFNKMLEDRVRSQTAELQASEEKYKTIFYKSLLPKWIYDYDTLQFLEVNDAAVRHYGYTQEEFLRMTIKDIRPEEDVPRLLEDVEVIRASPEVYQDTRWRHKKKNGEVIYVELTAHPIEYERKKARMVIVNDITERKKSEAMLQQLNQDLQKRAGELAASNGELERFAYIASHDLQEPLRMVSSFLQLLQKKYHGQLDEKASQYIHYAVDGAERMKALILDLLEYSRVGSGRESFVPVDLGEVMKEVGDIFREKIIAGRAKVEIGKMPVVMGDKVQLTQLLQNLVSNALKYHGAEPPMIRVKAERVRGGGEPSAASGPVGGSAGNGASASGPVGTGSAGTGSAGSGPVVSGMTGAGALAGGSAGTGSAASGPVVSGMTGTGALAGGSAGMAPLAGGLPAGVYWRFSVQDNGIGIDPMFFDKIFIIFQRLHNKSDYTGTGIGLAICKKIVERHGGRIWVESSPGAGSTFFFTMLTQP